MKKIRVKTESKIDLEDLIPELALLNTDQKVEVAIGMCKLFGGIDMTYIELLLKSAAKKELLRIKNDNILYNKNRRYFNALKVIAKNKAID